MLPASASRFTVHRAGDPDVKTRLRRPSTPCAGCRRHRQRAVAARLPDPLIRQQSRQACAAPQQDQIEETRIAQA